MVTIIKNIDCPIWLGSGKLSLLYVKNYCVARVSIHLLHTKMYFQLDLYSTV